MTTLTNDNRAVTAIRDAVGAVVSTPLYWVMAGLLAGYIAAVWLVLDSIGLAHRLRFTGYYEIIGITSCLFMAGFVLFRLLFIMIIRRPARLTKAIVEDMAATCFSPRRLLDAAAAIIVFVVFFPVFTSFKTFMPDIVPFSWDSFFSGLDQTVTGGVQPWKALQPVLGFAGVTFTINFIYNLWFFVKFMMFYWQGFSRSHTEVRAQFFLTCLVSWIVNGTVLALLFSSAGPCYFSRVLPGQTDPYDGLMAYLHTVNEIVPVWALNAQNYLWKIYSENASGAMAGISAFPSMHVSIAFILLLAARHYGRAATAFFLMFFIFILFGSVHLGWHYAVDGYFAILSSGAIWIACGWTVRRYRLDKPRMGGALQNDRS